MQSSKTRIMTGTEVLKNKNKSINITNNAGNTNLKRQVLTQDQISSVNIKTSDTGLTWNDDSADNGDIVAELSGRNNLKMNKSKWEKLKGRWEYPVMAALMEEEFDKKSNAMKDLEVLAEDLVSIQEILKRKMEQENTVNKRIEKTEQECKVLSEQNIKLRHRIAFLEDQSEYFQKTIKQVAEYPY